MNLTSIIRIVLVVLVLGSREAGQKSRVHGIRGSGRVVRVRKAVIVRNLCRRGVGRRDANVFWVNVDILHVEQKVGRSVSIVEPKGCGSKERSTRFTQGKDHVG